MADHFFAINRGKEGFTEADIVKATSSTSAADIELRLADAAGLTRLDVRKALNAFERMLVQGNTVTDFPPE